MVEPRHTYTVTVFNLPEPEMRDNRIRKQITIPGELHFRILYMNMNYISLLYTQGDRLY